jgi:hypothetical protein
MPTTTDRKDLEGAAASYWHLRGLLYLPVGALLLLSALFNTDFGPDWGFLVGVAAAGLAWLAISRYYGTHYGRMRPSPQQEARGLAAVAVAIAAIALGAFVLKDTPLNPVAIAFAGGMLVSYHLGVGLRPHHVVVWGGLLVIGAIPVWDGADSANAGLALAGVAVIVSGLLDHRLFVRTFGPREAIGVGGQG